MTIDGTPKEVLANARKIPEWNAEIQAQEVFDEMYNEMLDALKVKWESAA